MNPWLVTGATGFLGRHVLTHLASEPNPLPISALVRNPDEWHRLDWTSTLDNVRVTIGDVTTFAEEPSRQAAQPAVSGILHLAALVSHRRADETEVTRVNVQGTVNMVRLAAVHRCRVIFVSTSGTVGCFREPDRTAFEDAPYCEAEVRHWPYYRSKIQAEKEARALARERGVELVIVRPPILLGPGDHRHRSTAHVKRFMDGKVPIVIRGGMHFADIRDAAAALVRVMRLPAPRPVYHLPGIQCSIEAFHRDIARIAEVPPPRAVVPYRLAWIAATASHALRLGKLPEPALVEMAAHYWGLGSHYAEAELGYRTRPGDQTLRDTVEWLRANPS
jgi:nucleoside-diphosphate-sugar epimerase